MVERPVSTLRRECLQREALGPVVEVVLDRGVGDVRRRPHASVDGGDVGAIPERDHEGLAAGELGSALRRPAVQQLVGAMSFA